MKSGKNKEGNREREKKRDLDLANGSSSRKTPVHERRKQWRIPTNET